MAYKIIRHYQDPNMAPVLLTYVETLDQAEEWCRDPQTSSSTAWAPEATGHTESYGPWFDGYEEVTP